MARQSTAYDLSIYEPKVRRAPEPQQPKLEVVKNDNPRRRSMTLGDLVQAAGIAVLLLTAVCLIIYNNVLLTELSDEIDRENSRYQAYMSEYVRLSAQIEGKMSMRSIEQIAKDELGLSKMESYQIEYVDRGEGERIILSAPEEQGPLAKVADKVAAALEYLRVAVNKDK